MKKTDQVKKKQPWVIITNGLYDFLKFFLLVIAPSSAAIYLWLSTIFRLGSNLIFVSDLGARNVFVPVV